MNPVHRRAEVWTPGCRCAHGDAVDAERRPPPLSFSPWVPGSSAMSWGQTELWCGGRDSAWDNCPQDGKLSCLLNVLGVEPEL